MTSALGWSLGLGLVAGARGQGIIGGVDFTEAAVRADVEAADLARRAFVGQAAEPFAKLASQFEQALTKLKERFQTAGKLDEMVAVEKEIAAIVPGVTIQQESKNADIARLQGIYRSQVDRQASRKRSAMLTAEQRYHEALEAMVPKVARAGKTADAVLVKGLIAESARRIECFKAMIAAGEDHLVLCDKKLCRLIESPRNDGKDLVEVGRSYEVALSVDDPKPLGIREAIFMPTGRDRISILEYDITPGFRFLSLVGVAAFDGYVWARYSVYAVQVDGVDVALFNSDQIHWPRIVLLPENAKTLRLCSRSMPHDNNHAHMAWPRLHTGLSSVSEATGWPAALQALHRKQGETPAPPK